MSFFKKLLRRSPAKPARKALPIDASLRDRVINGLEQECPGLVFSPDAVDPAKICVTENAATIANLDLSNLAGQIRAYDTIDIEQSITQYARAFAKSRDLEATINTDHIYPALRPNDYIEQVKALNADLVVSPFYGDLQTIYMSDNTDSMQAVNAADIDASSSEILHTQAVQNLRKWLPRLVCDNSQKVMYLYYVQDNPLLTSGLVHLPEFWQLLEERHGSEFLFALPRKDQLFVFEPSFHKQMVAAKMLVNATWEDNFNLLSPMTFKWVDGDIEVLGKL